MGIGSVTATVVLIALWSGTWAGAPWGSLAPLRWPLVVFVAVALVLRFPRWAMIGAAVLAGAAGGASAWDAQVVTVTERCEGVMRLVGDPVPLGAGTRVVLEHRGIRLAAVAFGTPSRVLARRSAHDRVSVSGTCSPLDERYAARERVRHVVGRITVESVSERFVEPSPLVRSASRVRAAMDRGVADMPREERSLFTGLVVGDDRLQPREMVERFRESGLSHLCAASGQNVAYLLALAGPMTRGRTQRTRWVITMLIIGWFVVLTRAEPSVLRAGAMAAAVATNALVRNPMNSRAVLALSASCLLVVDPMLARSIGFALSVGATAGLAWLSAPLGRALGGRGVLATTLAAQAGTLPVSMAVFGSVPVVSLVANPLALPVAGVVMTVGLPVSMLAATVPPLVGPVSWVMTVPVAWVDLVARVCAGLSLRGAANTVSWVVVALVVLWRWRSAVRRTRVAG